MTPARCGDLPRVDAAHLPGDAELVRGITAMAENVVALAKAPKGEDYSGPVLFEGAAGAQIFAEVLARNLTLTAASGGRRRTRRRRRRTANWKDAWARACCPIPSTWWTTPRRPNGAGGPLFGSYKVDREGVLAKPLRLIEKGVLKNYLLTRQPVRGFEGSNGRARLPGSFGTNAASISNLFVSTTEPVPVAEMKKKLIELCQDAQQAVRHHRAQDGFSLVGGEWTKCAA